MKFENKQKKLPAWMSLFLAVGYGIFDKWDSSEMLSEAWKTSLLACLGILAMQCFSKSGPLGLFSETRKKRNLKKIFVFALVVPGAGLVIVLSHFMSFTLACGVSRSCSLNLDSLSTLAILPLAFNVARRPIARKIHPRTMLSGSLVRIFILGVLIAALAALLPMGFHASANLLNMASSGQKWIFWIMRPIQYMAIFSFMLIPEELIIKYIRRPIITP